MFIEIMKGGLSPISFLYVSGFIYYGISYFLIRWDSWLELVFNLNIGQTGSCKAGRTGLGGYLAWRSDLPYSNNLWHILYTKLFNQMLKVLWHSVLFMESFVIHKIPKDMFKMCSTLSENKDS